AAPSPAGSRPPPRAGRRPGAARRRRSPARPRRRTPPRRPARPTSTRRAPRSAPSRGNPTCWPTAGHRTGASRRPRSRRDRTVAGVRSNDYGTDVLAGDRRRKKVVPTVPAEPDLVVEEAGTGFCGAVVECAKDSVTLEDRHGRQRVFPLGPAGFLLDGRPVTLTRPGRTASGSIAVEHAPARVARGSRIWVEGVHDAALVERVWGDDLRVEAV